MSLYLPLTHNSEETMVILKFGGTSVGTADRMQEVIDILEKRDQRHLVVLSAMSGTTNALVEIARAKSEGEVPKANDLILDLERKYVRVLTDLFPEKEIRDQGRILLRSCFKTIKELVNKDSFNEYSENEILAQGELMSTSIFTLQCKQRGVEAVLLPALDFMRTNNDSEPDYEETKSLLLPFLENLDEEVQVLVTQGYICRNNTGAIDNLKRGGSDYTATIIGALLQAEEIQIWTDVDGFQTNDPRIVEDTIPVRRLSYREAAELAYFGAKILHPTCVIPAERYGVPIRLKCTMEPEAEGTLISNESSARAITAVSAKDGITAIKIYSHRMYQAYGFLRKVFDVFENHQTSVDMITTSEVAVSMTVDDTLRLDSITDDLSRFAEVDHDSDYSIVCVVGNSLYDESKHVGRIFDVLKDIPIRMVSMGGSRNNVSLLIKTQYKKQALRSLNSLFETVSQEALELA